ncbi:MAG: hypothetical protein FWE97_03615, partial [Dehalococcoidia bacterium]|nr:hypothetical protein [Dehalococcoidia bacterium]
LSIIAAIAGVIVFILTENMSNPMVLVDRWTIVNAIILVLGAICAVPAFKNKKADTSHYKS